jgi:CHAT domain-containing protein
MLCLLGANLYKSGRYVEAEAVFQEAADGFESARLRAGAGIKRATFQSSPYEGLVNCRLKLGKFAEAWSAHEAGLGRAIGDLLLAAEKRSLAPQELAREQSLLDEISVLQGELSAFYKADPETLRAAEKTRRDGIYSKLLATESEWSTFQAGITQKYPMTEGGSYSLERIQGQLDPHSAIIGWAAFGGTSSEPGMSWGYVIRNRGPVVWRKLPVGRATTQGGVAGAPLGPFRSLLASRLSSVDSLRAWCERLGRERVQPLLPDLQGVTHIVVIPSGSMVGIPIEPLSLSDGKDVSDEYAVVYATSSTIYAWSVEQNAKAKPGRDRQALIVGDPPFCKEQMLAMRKRAAEEAQPGLESAGEEPHLLRAALGRDSIALARLPRLAGSREEAREVAAVFPRRKLLLGPEASESALALMSQSDGLRRYSVLHFATHALVDPDSPDRSAIILSQINLEDPVKSWLAGKRPIDGVVTATEIIRDWRLNADLVTLSACESGLGKKVPGEGYVGLWDAFLEAGAKSVLASLWKVDDRATSLLMKRFYENWILSPGTSKADALREARRWLRDYTDKYGERPFAHPFFWSGRIPSTVNVSCTGLCH